MNAIEPGRGTQPIEIPAHLNFSARPSAELMVTLIAPMLSRIARRYESDALRRSELQQEMLIALWLSLDTFAGSAEFQIWVNSVAHRVGTQHVMDRRLSRRSEPRHEPAPTSFHDPESIVANRERAHAVLSMLDGLRRREREVVLLHLQEFELDEMCNAMKICRTQVRETLVRARRRLLKRLQKTEHHAVPELGAQPKEPLEALDKEPARRRARGRGPTRGATEEDGVYFIEPISTKARPNGCA